MTIGWFIFGVVMPAFVAGAGWLYGQAHLRWLRRNDEERAREAKLAE